MKSFLFKRIRKPALVVGLGVVLYLISRNAGAGWLYVVAATIAAVVVVSALAPWWNVRGIEVKRRAPTLATAGEPFEYSLEVRSRARLARHLLELEDRFAGDEVRAVVVRVERVRPETVGYTLENPRRGVYGGGEVTVESGAPFGLFYRRRRMRVASEIVVYPRIFAVAGLPPSAVVDAERGDKVESTTLHRGHGGEFWGVREYRSGDPARLIAWKRSTRGLPAGRLAIVELAQESHPPFKVALNLDPRAPQEARERSSPPALRCSCTVSERAGRSGPMQVRNGRPSPRRSRRTASSPGARSCRPAGRQTPKGRVSRYGRLPGGPTLRGDRGPPRCRELRRLRQSCLSRATSSPDRGTGCRRKKRKSL
jgi:uncharacterized protein (DUF58 family)